MISIVICSTSPHLPATLRNNIEAHIGVPFEIICLDNSKNTYSIFSAYNEGVSRSSYDVLCFMHEDVLFHTMDFGKTILEHLKDPSVGIVGVCGCATYARIPSPWSLYAHFKYVLQSTHARGKSTLLQSGFEKRPDRKQVLMVDGLFMCAKKKVFETIHFDETGFSGYHAYDIDICLQAHTRGYKNYAVNDILIEHFSKGYHNKGWVVNYMALTDKWSNYLPLSLEPVSKEQLEKMEYRYMTENFAKYLIRTGYSNKECTRIIVKYLGHHERSNSGRFAQTIFLKTLMIRLLKNPCSFFPSLFRPSSTV